MYFIKKCVIVFLYLLKAYSMKYLYTLILIFVVAVARGNACDPNTHGLYFNGSNAYVEYAADNDLNITYNLTVEAWIKASSFGSSPVSNSIVCKHGWTSGEKGYVLRAGGDGQLSFTIAGLKSNGVNESWQEVLSPVGSLQLNTWYHVAGTFDGNKLRLYINGSQVASKSYNGRIDPSVNYNLKIGRIADEGAASDRYFHGLIDEVRIWKEARSSSEISNNYNEHINPSSVNNLVGYWRFNDGSGTDVQDRGTGNNQGTLKNASWNTDVPFTNGISRPSVTQYGNSLASSSLYGNQWNLNGVPISGENGIVFTPQQGGEYSVTVNYGFGCSATSQIFTFVITALDENSFSSQIKFYQSDGLIQFTLSPSFSTDSKLRILDLNGRVVLERKSIPEQIDMRSYARGIYIINVLSDKGVFSKKLAIQ